MRQFFALFLNSLSECGDTQTVLGQQFQTHDLFVISRRAKHLTPPPPPHDSS